MSHSGQQTDIWANKAEATKKANVIDVPEGDILRASDYAGLSVFLIAGKAEIHRPGLVTMTIQSNGKWNAKESIFTQTDRDIYVRCSIASQFLILEQKEKYVNKYTKDVIKSERLYSQVRKVNDNKNQINKAPATKQENRKLKADTIEVSIYDLDRPYEDTIELPPEINNYLSTEIEEIAESKARKSIEAVSHSITQQYKKSEATMKSVKNFLVEKMPAVVDGFADMIDKSLEVSNENISLEHGSFSDIGYWKAAKIKLPEKNGIYYVSDGKQVKVVYFNKNKGSFHDAENMKIKFWSSKNVEL